MKIVDTLVHALLVVVMGLVAYELHVARAAFRHVDQLHVDMQQQMELGKELSKDAKELADQIQRARSEIGR